MKDINGLEFKAGCVIGVNEDEYLREVTKILQDGRLVTWSDHYDLDRVWDEDMLKRATARILHYRELAPDKNGKMLCEGDRVTTASGRECAVVHSWEGNTDTLFIVKHDSGGWDWECGGDLEFVSRPTDVPNEVAKEKQELLTKADELIAKANELKQKAEDICN